MPSQAAPAAGHIHRFADEGMKFSDFIGPTYKPSAYSLECQLTKNWYTEKIESGKGRAPYGMLRTPGRKLFLPMPRRSTFRRSTVWRISRFMTAP